MEARFEGAKGIPCLDLGNGGRRDAKEVEPESTTQLEVYWWKKKMRGVERKDGVATICFSNITEWPEKARHQLLHLGADVWIAVETHIKPEG